MNDSEMTNTSADITRFSAIGAGINAMAKAKKMFTYKYTANGEIEIILIFCQNVPLFSVQVSVTLRYTGTNISCAIKNVISCIIFSILSSCCLQLNMPKTRGEIKMTKKISKKELKKFKEQMGVSDIRHNRPPVGRPAVFVGVTSKRRRREGKKEVRDYD